MGRTTKTGGRDTAGSGLADEHRKALDDYGQVEADIHAAWAKILIGESADSPERIALTREREKTKVVEEMLETRAADRAGLPVFEERSIGAEDFLKLDYFVKGLVAARCVGRIDAMGGMYHGTGFLCGPGFVMTNNHVLPNAEAAASAEIGLETFNGRTVAPDIENCRLDPDHFFFTSPKNECDVTIVALAREPNVEEICAEIGWHPLISAQGKIKTGDPVGVIQYPKGRRKSVVVHNSSLVHIRNGDALDRYLWYTSDTEPGSSGSPVFNKHWEVVALHHRAVPKTTNDGEHYVDKDGEAVTKDEAEADPSRVVWIANQGIRASRIVEALSGCAFEGRTDHAERRDLLLKSWETGKGQEKALMQTRERIARIQAIARHEARAGRGADGGHERIGFESAAAQTGPAQGGINAEIMAEILRRMEDGSLPVTFNFNISG